MTAVVSSDAPMKHPRRTNPLRRRATMSPPSQVHDVDRDVVWHRVEAARGGDQEAFAELYEMFADRVHRFICGRGLGILEPEDVLAETFITAWRRMGDFVWTGAPFVSWLFAIAGRHCQTRLRSAARKPALSLESLPDGVVASGHCVNGTPSPNSMGDDGLHLLRALPDDQQLVLLLRFYGDLSVDDTALAMDRTAGAVRQLQLRALERLRRMAHEEAA